MTENLVLFTSSLRLDKHPMKTVNLKIKTQYYLTLEYIVQKCTLTDFIMARLKQYREMLVGDGEPSATFDDCINIDAVVRSIVNTTFRPWRKKYRYWLLCDVALILLDESSTESALKIIKNYLKMKPQTQLDELFTALKQNVHIEQNIPHLSFFTEQYHNNYEFVKKPSLCCIVTANMSAGKSTLINALIGKPITRTSQEVCTGNICRISNKPYEDSCIHLKTSQLIIDANHNDLFEFEWVEASDMASYFRTIVDPDKRLTIIDTPGINAALNKKHGKIAKNAIQSGEYDKLIYVLNANKIGTDEEMKYLKWIFKNASSEKIIFVLNKLDDFKSADDSIEKSINGIQKDLTTIGFRNPFICPLSAYYALLLKMKDNGDVLTDDDDDQLALYVKKFSKQAYDLSKYYKDIDLPSTTNEVCTEMYKKCGMYGFEKTLFGGII